MKNYGESLAYWYFRLNGFIPMTDFVLHGDDRLKSSDCDLVAVRFPHVWEKVGGQDNDWHDLWVHDLQPEEGYTLATFVQVKTGKDDGNRAGELKEYFKKHLEYLVWRLGFWPKDVAQRVARDFQETNQIKHKGYKLSKVVVLRDLRERRVEPQWFEWRLLDLVMFIEQRMVKYKPDKFESRMHFPDPLIQLYAEQAMNQEFRFPTVDRPPLQLR
ncbi:MAG TPA: hypothetical protein VM533_09665 [Fimbriiglobus sp.]|jgi:hypothetical protein|nr:hypothetical protein [Fimbriiglobus sp.]